jgi:hypothetical protein
MASASVTIREPAAAPGEPEKPQTRRRAACYLGVCSLLLLLGAALGLGLGLGLRPLAPAAAAEPPVTVLLSTPASELTTELAAGLRCDVALALSIPPSLVVITESVLTSGASATVTEGAAGNLDTSCGARALQLARSMPAVCGAPQSQKLSSLRVWVKASLSTAVVNAAVAAMLFPSAWREKRLAPSPPPNTHTPNPGPSPIFPILPHCFLSPPFPPQIPAPCLSYSPACCLRAWTTLALRRL